MHAWIRAGACVAALFIAAPASAQIVQSVQFGGGVFFPRSLDNRPDDDVLVRNFFGEGIPGLPGFTDALAFDVSDFRSGQLFGEWNVTFGDRVEFGAGIGYYADTIPTVYRDLVDQNDREIEQELRLRVVPISAVVRFLPFGRAGDIQPYAGIGISALNYEYSEIGDFVDPVTLDVLPAQNYVANGTTPGVLLLGGVRIPITGDIFGFTVEGRYQFGKGDTGGIEAGFLEDTIDLSGFNLSFAMLVRF